MDHAPAVNKDYNQQTDRHFSYFLALSVGSSMGSVLYQGVRLVFGTLYPAYFSFKAVKTKNVKVSLRVMTAGAVKSRFRTTSTG